jgi:hypothetical protein
MHSVRTAAVARIISIMLFKNASDDIFIDVESKSRSDFKSYPWAAKPGVAPFYFQNSCNELSAQVFWIRTAIVFRSK